MHHSTYVTECTTDFHCPAEKSACHNGICNGNN